MIDIKGIDKAALLAALHNGTVALGLGRLHDRGKMTRDEAAEIVNELQAMARPGDKWALDFDYVRGRPVKSNITGDELDPRLYDRDAGEGAAARVVAALRERLSGAA